MICRNTVVATLVAVPLYALSTRAAEHAHAQDEVTIEEACTELVRYCWRHPNASPIDPSEEEATTHSKIVQRIKSSPGDVWFNAAGRILLDPEGIPKARMALVYLLQQAGRIGPDIPRGLLGQVRNEKLGRLQRARALRMLLATDLLDVAPRAQLEEVVEEYLRQGDKCIRRWALLYAYRLKEPRFLGTLIEVAGKWEEDPYLARRAMGGLMEARKMQIVPEDLVSTVDRLIAEVTTAARDGSGDQPSTGRPPQGGGQPTRVQPACQENPPYSQDTRGTTFPR
jgi:hypothetical protein